MSPSNRLSSLVKRFRWVFVLLLILLLGLLAAVWAYRDYLMTPRGEQTTQAGEITRVVRASFPQFCAGSQLVIEPSPVDTEPDSYWVGCASTWDRFGAALALNVATCEVQFVSLTLASEFSNLPRIMPICPTDVR